MLVTKKKLKTEIKYLQNQIDLIRDIQEAMERYFGITWDRDTDVKMVKYNWKKGDK